MRYAIGYTFINEETNFVSRPYLLTISKNNVFDLKIDKFSEIKNERLVVVPTVEFGKNLMQTLKKLQVQKGNFYLLKIDSLNFPYQISKKIYYLSSKNTYYANVLKLK